MEVQNSTNYEKAIAEADAVEKKIIEVLQSGNSFRVEAGAGSGKTYSLNKVIEWLQKNRWADYKRKKQQVICITYTNAAVDVIANRLNEDSFIIPSTIHSFAWGAISLYQSTLKKMILEDESLHPTDGDLETVKNIQYTLGHRYIDNGVMYLYHNDVITLFSLMLDNPKFRKIFIQKYPLILIDEYQDSFKQITDKFINYFISQKIGSQFGFFGDSWQTIYQSNNVCGLITDENIIEIKKTANFRCAPRIVDALNFIRPSLPQISAIDAYAGEVIVVTCNDYNGVRRTDRGFKDDLPAEILEDRLSNFINQYKKCITKKDESLKTLMITHKVLASQQGYSTLLGILGDGLKNEDDPILLLLMNIVEPIYEAITTQNMPLLFETLGIKRYPINSKAEKLRWNEFSKKLGSARTQTVEKVLSTIIESGLVPIPPQVSSIYQAFLHKPDTPYQTATIADVFSVSYSEFISAIEFLKPTALYSTEHGVKGEEYDNVIFVISRGWNNYQFDKYIPMLNSNVPDSSIAAFERNRNLFYVCCSRPRKRLVLFVTVPVKDTFMQFFENMVGTDNIYTYPEYIAHITSATT